MLAIDSVAGSQRGHPSISPSPVEVRASSGTHGRGISSAASTHPVNTRSSTILARSIVDQRVYHVDERPVLSRHFDTGILSRRSGHHRHAIPGFGPEPDSRMMPFRKRIESLGYRQIWPLLIQQKSRHRRGLIS